MTVPTAFVALCFVLGSTEVALGKYVRSEGNESQNSEGISQENGWVDQPKLPESRQPSHEMNPTRPVSESADGVLRSSPGKLPSKESKDSSKDIARLAKTEHAGSSSTDARGTAGTESEDEEDLDPTEASDLDSPEEEEIDAGAAGAKGEHVLDDDTPEANRSADAPIRRKEVDPQADDPDLSRAASGADADGVPSAPADPTDAEDDQSALQKERKANSKSPTKASELVKLQDELPPWEDKDERNEPGADLPFTRAPENHADKSNKAPNSSDSKAKSQQATQPESEWLDKYVKKEVIQTLEALHEDPDPRSLHADNFASRLAQRFYSKDIRDIKVNSHGVVLAESTKEEKELRASREDSESGLAAIFSPSFGKRTKTLAEAKARGQKQK